VTGFANTSVGCGLAVLVLLIGGCTTASDPFASTVPTAVPEIRPRAVRTDDLHPCTLLSGIFRTERGLDREPQFQRNTSLLYPGSASQCSTAAAENSAYSVTVSNVDTVGIEFFASGTFDGEVRRVGVAHFPAVVAVSPRYTDFCNVLVDVAPGRMLDIMVRDAAPDPIPQEQLCHDAERIAGLVMNSLFTLR
jgi:hypothetical protein